MTDTLADLKARIAAEEGIPDWAEDLHGGNERQIRDFPPILTLVLVVSVFDRCGSQSGGI